jgi:FAD/FMN-containing dehydrogenase
MALTGGPLAPFAVDVINAGAADAMRFPEHAHLIVRCGGEEAEVDAQLAALAKIAPGEVLDERRRNKLRDFQVANIGNLACRVSLLPHALAALVETIEREASAAGLQPAMQAHAGTGILRLRLRVAENATGVGLRFLGGLRFLARRHGGHLFIEQLPAALAGYIDAWGPVQAPAELLLGISRALDPQGVFSPGRLIARPPVVHTPSILPWRRPNPWKARAQPGVHR